MSTNLQQSIERSKNRLSGGPYGIEEVFRPDSYDWPGDWEGRALLAFACHKQMNNEIPCMKAMLACFPEKIGEKGYFGRSFDENAIDEQQLSGHNWLLRGLLEAEKAGEESAGVFADKLVENLYKTGIGELIEDERRNSDYVIIDSSPVRVAADTELILSHVDAVLLVVRQDWSEITEINHFADVLAKSNVEFLGYVLNDFKNQNPIARNQYDYGYGKQYKKYGYGESGN
jgi:hypothetical protein